MKWRLTLILFSLRLAPAVTDPHRPDLVLTMVARFKTANDLRRVARQLQRSNTALQLIVKRNEFVMDNPSFVAVFFCIERRLAILKHQVIFFFKILIFEFDVIPVETA